jgi:hypothetical protein
MVRTSGSQSAGERELGADREDVTGGRDDSDHQERLHLEAAAFQPGDRDGHEHDGLAVHQCMKQPPRKPSRTGGGRGSPSSSTERGCGVFMAAPTLRLAARPESPHPQAR